ncbi:hypothetical protein ACSFXN_04345 [Planococcus sp. 1R117A]|uniref:hypothetical protein n=1 Tax=Planococcus sp. 1R117A TaxID=3447020 RepID=UPI003EDBEA02
MKRLVILALVCLSLAACQSHTVIDWVDFIQFEGKHYTSVDSAVIKEESGIGKKAGEVNFKVADNISNPNYQVKNGDAAFWEKDTGLFEVIGFPELLAVADEHEVNGYRLYVEEQAGKDFPHHFKDVELEQVKSIEIYTGENVPELLNRITDAGELEEFKRLLTEAYIPPPEGKAEQQDPDIYQMVLYTDAKLAHSFYLYKENGQWLWYPWEQQFLPDEIGKLIKP